MKSPRGAFKLHQLQSTTVSALHQQRKKLRLEVSNVLEFLHPAVKKKTSSCGSKAMGRPATDPAPKDEPAEPLGAGGPKKKGAASEVAEDRS